MELQQDASGGSARRRRDQRQRGVARRVAWLTGLLQQAACHHSSALQLSGLWDKIERLQKDIVELRARLSAGQVSSFPAGLVGVWEPLPEVQVPVVGQGVEGKVSEFDPTTNLAKEETQAAGAHPEHDEVSQVNAVIKPTNELEQDHEHDKSSDAGQVEEAFVPQGGEVPMEDHSAKASVQGAAAAQSQSEVPEANLGRTGKSKKKKKKGGAANEGTLPPSSAMFKSDAEVIRDATRLARHAGPEAAGLMRGILDFAEVDPSFAARELRRLWP